MNIKMKTLAFLALFVVVIGSVYAKHPPPFTVAVEPGTHPLDVTTKSPLDVNVVNLPAEDGVKSPVTLNARCVIHLGSDSCQGEIPISYPEGTNSLVIEYMSIAVGLHTDIEPVYS